MGAVEAPARHARVSSSPPPATAEGGGGAAAAAAGLYLLFVFFSLLQQPGATTYDTRAELTQRPLGFLAEAFTLWHPESSFGEFQNQAYGYLFPQGTWFALGDLANLPDWVSQRLWTALVLIVACEGARRVARVVGFAPGLALLAGLVFGFSPRLLGTVAVITGEALPGAVLPWVLLPVLLAVRGRIGPGLAAVLSAAAVVCMGGVNAVENAGALPLVAIVVVWAVRRRVLTRRFLGQWVAAVVVASLWWTLPLLVLAGYAPPFYEYVESAADTTALIGWSEAARGDSHWVAYLITGDQSWWPAAHDLVSVPWLIVLSAVIAAIGLWGLARLDHPLRGPLMLAAVVGLGALTIAHGGWAGSPVADPVQRLLDGPLQIFRNVHKIDPTVRLPLALGFAQAVAVALEAVVGRRPSLTAAGPALLGAPLVLVLALGQPYLVNHARTPGWEQVAEPWQQAQTYLAEHEDGRTTLIVPGSGFAQQTWGWTLDEPLLVLGGVNRVTRSQIPLIPGQSIRFLAALDRLVSSGRATPQLGRQLARAGIGHVVLRRDLDRTLTGSPPPSLSAVSLSNAGLESVARFGEAPATPGRIDPPQPSVEVLEVAERLPTLRTTPVADVVTVRGAPESILSLQEAGLVGDDQASVLEGEPGWDARAEVVTDGDQRRERAFGASDDAVSAVMGPDDAWRTSRAVHDYPTVAGARPVVADYVGLSDLTASSSQGYADNFGPVVPQAGPGAAIDDDRRTRWVTSAASDPREQWLRLDFDEPRRVSEVSVLPVVDDSAVVPIRELSVVAGDQTQTLEASPSGAPSVARFDGSLVSSVEVRVDEVATTDSSARVGLREVSVNGLTPTRSWVVPGEVDPDAAWSFDAGTDRRACLVTLGAPDCSVARIRAAEEPDGLSRTFTLSDDLVGDQRYDLAGRVVARSTPEAARLLEPLSRRQVGATSVYGADPRVASRFAYDGQPTTSWVSSDDDDNPTLLFEFPRPRTVRGLTVTQGSSPAAPVEAVVSAGGRSRTVSLDGSQATFPRLSGTRIEVSFVKADGQDHVVVPDVAFLGFNVTRPFLADEPTGAVCGLGPSVVVDGRRVPTRVTGTMGDVVNGSPMSLEACVASRSDDGGRAAEPDAQPGVELGAGEHRVVAAPSAQFQVTALTGVPAVGDADEAADADISSSAQRSVDVTSWSATERRATVGGGAESLLYLPENFNTGWSAELDGAPLRALRVDGWQQAWVLPAGAGGALTLRYAPQRVYDVLLPVGLGLSGAILLAGLVLLVLGRLRPRPRRRTTLWPDLPRGSGPLGLAVAAVAGLVLLGPVSLVGLVAGVVAARPWSGRGDAEVARAALAAALGAALVVLSGVLDVVGGPRWLDSLADASAAVGVGVVAGLVLGGARARLARQPQPVAPAGAVGRSGL